MTSELLRLARSIAAEAAELALRRRREGVTVAASKSTPVDVVTETDREVEALIRHRIVDARPGDGFFGEESGAERGTSGLTWVVDPIDGTVNFLYGIPHWAVSIAVVEGEPEPRTWRALAGVVVDAPKGEVFTAAAGEGAFLADEPIRASAASDPALSLLATGFSYSAERRVQQADAVRAAIGRVRDIRRAGTASLDLCYVAAGRLDAYIERGLHPWDHAAGALIAAEAGAVVEGEERHAADAGLVIASAPQLADAIREIVRDTGM